MTARRLLFQIHLWIGLFLCIPFAILGLTGSVLVYDQEIEGISKPVPYAAGVGAPAAPSAILATAQAGHDNLVPSMLVMPASPGDPASVRLGKRGERAGPPGRGSIQVFVDPVTLSVLGTREGPRNALVGFAHDIHGSMMLGRAGGGRSIVGWLGVGMTILGLSGLIMWWPKKGAWHRAIGVKHGLRGFLYYRQWHATAGVSLWLVFVVVSFSGVVIAFPDSTGDAIHAVFGGNSSAGFVRARVEPARGQNRIGADEAVAVAASAAPNTRLAMMFLPGGPNDVYRINMAPRGSLVHAPAVTVTVDPYRGRAVSVRDARTSAAGDSILMWQRPLHTGDGFGEIGKFLVFLVGLLPTLFAITGVCMWLAKRRARQRILPGLVAEGAAAE